MGSNRTLVELKGNHCWMISQVHECSNRTLVELKGKRANANNNGEKVPIVP